MFGAESHTPYLDDIRVPQNLPVNIE